MAYLLVQLLPLECGRDLKMMGYQFHNSFIVFKKVIVFSGLEKIGQALKRKGCFLKAETQGMKETDTEKILLLTLEDSVAAMCIR